MTMLLMIPVALMCMIQQRDATLMFMVPISSPCSVSLPLLGMSDLCRVTRLMWQVHEHQGRAAVRFMDIRVALLRPRRYRSDVTPDALLRP